MLNDHRESPGGESVEVKNTDNGLQALQSEFRYKIFRERSGVRDWLRNQLGKNIDFDIWVIKGANDGDDDLYYQEETDGLEVDAMKAYLKQGNIQVLIERCPELLFEDRYGHDIPSALRGEAFDDWIAIVGVDVAKKSVERFVLSRPSGSYRYLHPELLLSAFRKLNVSIDAIDHSSLRNVYDLMQNRDNDPKADPGHTLWVVQNARHFMNRFEEPDINPAGSEDREGLLGAWLHLEKISEYLDFAHSLRHPEKVWNKEMESVKSNPYFENSYVAMLQDPYSYHGTNRRKSLPQQERISAELHRKSNAHIGESVFRELTGRDPEGLVAATKLFGGGWTLLTASEQDFLSLTRAKRKSAQKDANNDYKHTSGLFLNLDGAPINITKLAHDNGQIDSEEVRATLLHEEQHAIWSQAPWILESRSFAREKSESTWNDLPHEIHARITNELSAFLTEAPLRDDRFYAETLTYLYLKPQEKHFAPIVRDWLGKIMPVLRAAEPYLKTAEDRAVLGLCLKEGSLTRSYQQLKESVDLLVFVERELKKRVDRHKNVTHLMRTAEQYLGSDYPAFHKRYLDFERDHQELLQSLPTLVRLKENSSVQALLKEHANLDFAAWDAYCGRVLEMIDSFQVIQNTRDEALSYPSRYSLDESQQQHLSIIANQDADHIVGAFQEYVHHQFFLESGRTGRRITPDQAGVLTKWLSDTYPLILEEIHGAEEEGYTSGRLPLGFSMTDSRIEVTRVWFDRHQNRRQLRL
ncbi:MAG: hypothetical protein QG574_3646, partial [Cyanobacteriota bacterium erpe_2018_sw_21hr_WHONDRS-SW48-000092_B_bin.40]|nr:hypothetical protein [Cyanobacteriota bacterium erpe_2018_sw_21hr_WHONDRS-SW48-000092_B_bin.40]